MTPTPNENLDLESENPKKNFSKNPKEVTFVVDGRTVVVKKKKRETNRDYTKTKEILAKSRGGDVPKDTKILDIHRVIYNNYVEQGRRNLGAAIRRTNVYAPSVGIRPNIITKSQSWKALMNELMPEELLAQRHVELLNKRDYRKVTEVNAEGKEVTVEVDDGPNTAAVSKGLDMAYELRGSYKKDEAPPKSTVMYNLFYKPEVREQVKVFEESIKQSLINEANNLDTTRHDAYGREKDEEEVDEGGIGGSISNTDGGTEE